LSLHSSEAPQGIDLWRPLFTCTNANQAATCTCNTRSRVSPHHVVNHSPQLEATIHRSSDAPVLKVEELTLRNKNGILDRQEMKLQKATHRASTVSNGQIRYRSMRSDVAQPNRSKQPNPQLRGAPPARSGMADRRRSGARRRQSGCSGELLGGAVGFRWGGQPVAAGSSVHDDCLLTMSIGSASAMDSTVPEHWHAPCERTHKAKCPDRIHTALFSLNNSSTTSIFDINK
jgi:hypothetical protein